jgi:hypothetical protein
VVCFCILIGCAHFEKPEITDELLNNLSADLAEVDLMVTNLKCKNRVAEYTSREEAILAKYVPCGLCKP